MQDREEYIADLKLLICDLRMEVERLKGVIAESKDKRSKSGTIARLEDRYDRLWKDFSSISNVLQEIGVWTPGAGGTVVDAAYKAAVELTRLRARVAELEAKQLKPGEYVCRDVECPSCAGHGDYCVSPGGCDMEGECVEAPVYEQCGYCNGTGFVPERVV